MAERPEYEYGLFVSYAAETDLLAIALTLRRTVTDDGVVHRRLRPEAVEDTGLLVHIATAS